MCKLIWVFLLNSSTWKFSTTKGKKKQTSPGDCQCTFVVEKIWNITGNFLFACQFLWVTRCIKTPNGIFSNGRNVGNKPRTKVQCQISQGWTRLLTTICLELMWFREAISRPIVKRSWQNEFFTCPRICIIFFLFSICGHLVRCLFSK